MFAPRGSVLAVMALFGGATISTAQPRIDTLRSPVVANAQATVGGLIATAPTITITDLHDLVPASVLLEGDFAGYERQGIAEGHGSPAIDMALGLVLGRRVVNGHRRGPELRLGYTFLPLTAIGAEFHRTDRAPYDTLTSTLTGQWYAVDSVRERTVHVAHKASQLAFNASLIFRTHTDTRVTFFGGIGLQAGLAFDGRTEVEERIERYVERSDGGGRLDYVQLTDRTRNEVFTHENGTWYAGYIPVGIDLRLGRKHPFWRMVHLYHELRPAISFWDVPDMRKVSAVGIQALFGLRIDTSPY
ncbi:MAG: hypothetical protein H6594_12350 [Flavobacteriales bacterium]|nr:hypothetical protein [Flavobacteriales bacterium]